MKASTATDRSQPFAFGQFEHSGRPATAARDKPVSHGPGTANAVSHTCGGTTSRKDLANASSVPVMATKSATAALCDIRFGALRSGRCRHAFPHDAFTTQMRGVHKRERLKECAVRKDDTTVRWHYQLTIVQL